FPPPQGSGRVALGSAKKPVGCELCAAAGNGGGGGPGSADIGDGVWLLGVREAAEAASLPTWSPCARARAMAASDALVTTNSPTVVRRITERRIGMIPSASARCGRAATG